VVAPTTSPSAPKQLTKKKLDSTSNTYSNNANKPGPATPTAAATEVDPPMYQDKYKYPHNKQLQ
jgi:hypothetical protein